MLNYTISTQTCTQTYSAVETEPKKERRGCGHRHVFAFNTIEKFLSEFFLTGFSFSYYF